MKGEFNVEYIVSMVLFITITTYIIFQVMKFAPMYLAESRRERIRSEAYQLSELLLNDPGEPVYWDEEIGGWWNSSFSKRMNATINNSVNGNDLTNYQVWVNVSYDSDMQPDFDDLRFAYYNSTDGTQTELNYWIEEKVNSDYAETWIEVPRIAANSYETIYMYYGNSAVNSASNKSATMNFIETGQLTNPGTIDETGVITVSLDYSYDDPAVVAYIPTRGGGQSIDIRVRNVGSNSFEIFEEEPDNQGHNDETNNWMVSETGSFIALDGQLRIEAGTHSTDSVHIGGDAFGGDTVNFNNSFSSTPSVLATLNTYNNGAFMSTVTHSLSTTSFTVQQEAAETGISASTETIGWIAFSRDSGTNDGIDYEVGYHGTDGDYDGVENTAESISYSFGGNPSLVVQGSTATGINGYWARGAGTFSSTSANFFAEEDQVGDDERSHVDTGFSWAALYPQGSMAVRKFTSPEPTYLIGTEENISSFQLLKRLGLSDDSLNKTNLLSLNKIDEFNSKCSGDGYYDVKRLFSLDYDFSIFFKTKPSGDVLINCHPPEITARAVNVSIRRIVAINDGSYGELIVQMW